MNVVNDTVNNEYHFKTLCEAHSRKLLERLPEETIVLSYLSEKGIQSNRLDMTRKLDQKHSHYEIFPALF